MRNAVKTGSNMLKLHYLLIVSVICVAGCANMLTSKPQAPSVSVAQVVPLNLSLSKSELAITLRVNNPNSYDLAVQALDFEVFLAGEKMADGNSSDAVTIPANGEALMDVAVVAGMSTLWNQAKKLFSNDNTELKYSVIGAVKLANWPTRIPFNVERTLDNSTLSE